MGTVLQTVAQKCTVTAHIASQKALSVDDYWDIIRGTANGTHTNDFQRPTEGDFSGSKVLQLPYLEKYSRYYVRYVYA